MQKRTAGESALLSMFDQRMHGVEAAVQKEHGLGAICWSLIFLRPAVCSPGRQKIHGHGEDYVRRRPGLGAQEVINENPGSSTQGYVNSARRQKTESP